MRADDTYIHVYAYVNFIYTYMYVHVHMYMHIYRPALDYNDFFGESADNSSKYFILSTGLQPPSLTEYQPATCKVAGWCYIYTYIHTYIYIYIYINAIRICMQTSTAYRVEHCNDIILQVQIP